MDFFQIPDDYKPEKTLTPEEMQETTDYLLNHPLFMKQLPANVQDNPHLAALQNVIYDEPPEQLAETLNKAGNTRLAENPSNLYYMRDAYKKYTEGIAVKSPIAATNAKLHCNRAAINLKLRNFGKVIEDCKSALSYDNNYVKAYYRYAQALQSLKKFKECKQLLQDRKEEELVKLYKEACSKLEEEVKKIEKIQHSKQTTEEKIHEYCKKHGWKIKKRSESLPGNLKLQLIEDKLVIPLLVMYPEFCQFDVVQTCLENDQLGGHVQQLIQQLPWDTEGTYKKVSDLELFLEVQEAVMMKIPPSLKVDLALKKYAFPEAIELVVVSTKSKYYPQFIQSNKIVAYSQ